MYLLNYYPGVDTEIRDCRGFTALIKAAMKGRNDIVAILIMAGSYRSSSNSSNACPPYTAGSLLDSAARRQLFLFPLEE